MRLEVAMRSALSLANHGIGSCYPNPSVGCVILDKSNNLIGCGRTSDGGRPHAELNALSSLQGNPRGGTAFVTLEPCAHKDTTPSCAELLIKSGVKRVYISVKDPDKRTAGKGIKLLEKAGIEVYTGLFYDEASEQNAGFFKRINHGLPSVSLKIASSLDGKIACFNGQSKWLTGKIARTHGHLLRAKYDVILSGINSIIKDNSRLNCRVKGLEKRSPIKVVVDSKLSIPLSSNVINNVKKVPLIIWTSKSSNKKKKKELIDIGVEVLEIPKKNNNYLDLNYGLKNLSKKGYNSLLVEGGSEIYSSLIKEELVDKIYYYRSGKIIGGDGLSSISSYNLINLQNAKKFKIFSSEIIDGDILEIWKK